MRRKDLKIGQDYGWSDHTEWTRFPVVRVRVVDLGPFDLDPWPRDPIIIDGASVHGAKRPAVGGNRVAVRRINPEGETSGHVEVVLPAHLRGTWDEANAASTASRVREKQAADAAAKAREGRRAALDAALTRIAAATGVDLTAVWWDTPREHAVVPLDVLTRLADAVEEASR